jgi:hypothetical protein
MTPSANTWHVLPTDEGWEVLRHEQHLAAFATREEAIACARERSRHERGARVVIHSWSFDLEQPIPLGDERGDRGRVRWTVR